MNQLILSVNTTLNNSIGYRASPDRWEAADIGGTGDCKAIATGKQIRLTAAGFDTGLCTVATPSGKGHCVLCVRDGNEWWVLDNLTPDTKRPTETAYRWYLMQVGKRWRYVAWLRVFGRTIRLLGLKAPSPPGWDDYLARVAAGR